LRGAEEGGGIMLDGAAPLDAADDRFPLFGGMSQEREEEISDPESLVSAICLGSKEQSRIAGG